MSDATDEILRFSFLFDSAWKYLAFFTNMALMYCLHTRSACSALHNQGCHVQIKTKFHVFSLCSYHFPCVF